MRRALRWTPRILGLLCSGVLAIFALDVFGEGHGLWATMLALLIHLIPTFVILLVVVFAWRWPLVGAVVFLGLTVFFGVSSWGSLDWTGLFLFAVPVFATAALFFADFLSRRKRLARNTPSA